MAVLLWLLLQGERRRTDDLRRGQGSVREPDRGLHLPQLHEGSIWAGLRRGVVLHQWRWIRMVWTGERRGKICIIIIKVDALWDMLTPTVGLWPYQMGHDRTCVVQKYPLLQNMWFFLKVDRQTWLLQWLAFDLYQLGHERAYTQPSCVAKGTKHKSFHDYKISWFDRQT